MPQRAAQRPLWQVGTGSAPAGQSGGRRQRTAPQALDQASASSWARFAVSIRGQTSAAQQPPLPLTGSAAYVVVAQSASALQSAPPGGVGVCAGVGAGLGSSVGLGFSVGLAVGVGVAVGVGLALSVCDEQATTSTRSSARMGRLWQ